MNREEAKEWVKSQEPSFLTEAPRKVQGRRTYICPRCGNGSGSSGTGIVRIPDSKGYYKCFVCGLCSDVIGLWETATGDTGRKAFDNIYSYYGIEPDIYINEGKAKMNERETERINVKAEKEEADWRRYYEKCSGRLTDADCRNYLASRGISLETAERLGLGYDPRFDRSTGKYPWQAVIIPTGKGSFVARNISQNAGKDYRYRKVGRSHLFNAGELAEADSPVFVVEGEFDALSILEMGFPAVGLGSTSNSRQFLNTVKETKVKYPLIIEMDNDEQGSRCSKILSEDLSKAGIHHVVVRDNFGRAKDANEALVKNRRHFSDLLRSVSDAVRRRVFPAGKVLSAEDLMHDSPENGSMEEVSGKDLPRDIHTGILLPEHSAYDGEVRNVKRHAPDILFWIDMDGVIARWDSGASIEDTFEKGFFLRREAEPKVIDLILRMLESHRKVCILSAAYDKRVEEEKRIWLDQHGLADCRAVFVPYGENKAEYADQGDLNVLLDDFTKNLKQWEAASPNNTGIKFLNGINGRHGSWE